MNKTFRIVCIILGAIFLISGCYKIYMGLVGNDKKNDLIAQQSAVEIGQAVEDCDNVEFCVKSIEHTKDIGDEYSNYTTENNLVVVSIKITNNGTEPYDVNSLRFVLLDGEREYESSTEAILSLENHMYLDTINPGLTKEYLLVYETPSNVADDMWRLKIKHISYSEKDCVYINLE